MRRLALPILLAAAAPLAGCGDNGRKAPGRGGTTAAAPAQTTKTTYAPKKDAAGCTKVALPKPKGAGKLKRPKLSLSPGKTWTVRLLTNCGTIDIRLDVKRAPKTASSFAALVKSGFYDNLTFHRIVADFVVQGGDPLGNGQGGPGYNVDEKPPSDLQYTRGLVAMAKAGVDPPGRSGSQFFVVTAQDAGLPPDYALVGKVVKGMGTVDKMTAEPVNAQSFPLNAIVIQKATLSSS